MGEMPFWLTLLTLCSALSIIILLLLNLGEWEGPDECPVTPILVVTPITRPPLIRQKPVERHSDEPRSRPPAKHRRSPSRRKPKIARLLREEKRASSETWNPWYNSSD